MFQSNVYYYVRIKRYIVSTQELCLQKTYQDVPRKSENTCQKCTIFLCMHKILAHAQHSCACTRILCMYKNFDKQTPVLDQKAEPPVVFFPEKTCLNK